MSEPKSEVASFGDVMIGTVFICLLIFIVWFATLIPTYWAVHRLESAMQPCAQSGENDERPSPRCDL